MEKKLQGKFKRWYVTAFSHVPEVDKYLSDRLWVDDFIDATMFNESELEFVKQWLTENKPEGLTVIFRSVICEINGYDLGTIFNTNND